MPKLRSFGAITVLVSSLLLLVACGDTLSTATPPPVKGTSLEAKATVTVATKATATIAPAPTESTTSTPIIAPAVVAPADSNEWGVIKYNLDIIEKPQIGAKVTSKLKVDTLVAFEQKLSDSSWYMLAGGGWVASDSVRVYLSKEEAVQSLPIISAPPTAAPALKAQAQASQTGGVTFTAVNGGKPGSYASVTVKTIPNTACSISYVTPHGTQSVAKGLETKTSDVGGNVSWRWSIGPSTQPGTGTVRVTCGSIGGSSPIVIS